MEKYLNAGREQLAHQIILQWPFSNVRLSRTGLLQSPCVNLVQLILWSSRAIILHARALGLI